MYIVRNAIYALIWPVLLCAVLYAGVHPASAATRPCQKIIASGAASWEPVSYIDDMGRAAGVAVDVLRAYAQPRGIEVEMRLDIPWTQAMRMLRAGEIDVMAGAYFNMERAKDYLYTVPFASDEILVYQMRSRAFPVHGLADLIDHKGARPQGASYGDRLDAFADQYLNMVYAPTGQRIFDALINGRVDYVMLGRYDGMGNLLNDGIAQKVIAIEPPMAVNHVHFLFSRRSKCADLIPQINAMIRDLDRDDLLEPMVRKHLPGQPPG